MLALTVGVVGLGAVITGLAVVLVAAVLDAHGNDGPVTFALVWAGAISCSLGILTVLGAFLTGAVASLP